MANNNEDPKPVRKTWIMLKRAPEIIKNLFITKDNKKFMTSDGHEFLVKESSEEPIKPVLEYVSNGLSMHFSGEDDYIEGSWVDRISGYKFTPISTSTAPVYDADNKLYEAQSFGGMKSDFQLPASSEYSFEIVVRDFKNITSDNMSSHYAVLMGGAMDKYTALTDTLRLNRISTGASSNANKLLATKAGDGTHVMDRSEFEDNALDTFTFVPEVGLFRNGIKLMDLGASTTARGIGLFIEYSGMFVNYYRSKGKIHSVRMYNRQLTAEEVKQNYEVDKITYGE